jgi:soluble lytic murein transglycosylase
MRRFIFMLCALGIALPAIAEDDITTTYATWKNLRDPDTANITFTDGKRFLDEHPNWPEEKIIRLRTEAAAMSEHPARDVMANYCVEKPPISGRGMIACSSAGVGDQAKQAEWIRQGWIQGDFNENEEERILSSYGQQLKMADNIARAERLLYEAKLPAAKRMLTRVPAERRKLYEVRIAFNEKPKLGIRMLTKLSTAEQADPGILFERIRFRLHKSDDDITDLLVQAPKNAPYADEWWPLRANAARTAISNRNYALALQLLNEHGDLKPEGLADALFTTGWLHLAHQGDPGAAYKEFFKLYTIVTTPVSKARAAYWAGRAAEKNGNHDIALEWMDKAARRPTVFYGQLAYSWLHPHAPLKLPRMPEPNAEERYAFDSDESVRALRQFAPEMDEKTREAFLNGLTTRMKSDGQYAMLAVLANELNGMAGRVESAKLALKQDVVLMDAGWPVIELPPGNLGIEPALTLAITRQESQFNPDAKSPANARGLMQLLPGTAKHVAKKFDISYSDSHINDTTLNLSLGSHYLGQMVDGFNGSYILGIASYNAGPGSVRKWIKSMGEPPKTVDGAIDWIEGIPFVETRNYVMRVLENVEIYRARMDPDTPLGIEKDLVR